MAKSCLHQRSLEKLLKQQSARPHTVNGGETFFKVGGHKCTSKNYEKVFSLNDLL